jgi:hypothetical protein
VDLVVENLKHKVGIFQVGNKAQVFLQAKFGAKGAVAKVNNVRTGVKAVAANFGNVWRAVTPGNVGFISTRSLTL